MDVRRYDKPLLRIGAAFFAFVAIFGWDWSASYRTKFVDEWEPLVSCALLAFAAVAPTSLTMARKARPILYGLLMIDVMIFVWWLLERGRMTNGDIDFGGVVLRFVSAGIAFVLLLPRRDQTSERAPELDRII